MTVIAVYCCNCTNKLSYLLLCFPIYYFKQMWIVDPIERGGEMLSRAFSRWALNINIFIKVGGVRENWRKAVLKQALKT